MKNEIKNTLIHNSIIQKYLKNSGTRICKNHQIRNNLPPGKILILLSGRYKGKRVVYLKKLSTGYLVVSGPRKLNGVPICLVDPKHVLTTTTSLDIDGIDTTKIDEHFFETLRKTQISKKTITIKERARVKI